MHKHKEKEVQKFLELALESHYDSEIVHEYVRDDYRIDISLPDELIAIECKMRKTALKKGVGQCIRYEIDGFSSYLCTSKEFIDDTVKNMCLQAGVGLISVTDIAGKNFDVVIQNDIEIKGTSRSENSLRVSGSIKPYKLLDALDVTDMKSLHELEDNLINRRLVVVDDMKYRDGREIRTDHSILPET